MATTAELQADLQQVWTLEKAAWTAYVAESNAEGVDPFGSPAEADTWISTLGQGGIAGTVADITQATTHGIVYGQTGVATGVGKLQAAFNAWLALDKEAAQIWEALHPQGFNWLGVLPLVFVAGLGAAFSLGATAATTATAGSAAASAAPALPALTLAPISTAAVSSAATAAGASAASELASAGTAASTLSTIASTVGSGLTKLTGSSTIGNLVSSLLGTGGSWIADIAKFVEPLLSFGKSVLDDINAIDTKYIIPFTTFFTKEYDTVTGTIGTIQTLSREGLQGILAIPQAVSGAVSGLASGFAAAADATNSNQTDLVTNHLAPAIAQGVGEPIANFRDIFNAWAAPGFNDVGSLKSINPESIQTPTDMDTFLDNRTAALKEKGGLINDFWAELYSLVRWAIKMAGSIESVVTVGRYLGDRETRPAPLAMGELLEAWKRGVLTDETAPHEASYHGLSDARIAILKQLITWLPNEDRAALMWYRNVISAEDMDRILASKGMTKDDIKAFTMSLLEPVNPREVIAANGREAVKQAGWLPQSLGTPVPTDFKALYPPRLANPNIADLDWLMHWRIPNIEWWFTAYFRGLATKEDVTNAAKAENWPVEVIDKMFSVRQVLIQEWMIPDILAAGVMTDQEALDYMQFAGIEPGSAAILLKWAHSKNNAVNSQKAISLADKFEGQAKSMYMDGLINRDEYNLLLLDMGFNTEQAALMVGLADNEFDFGKRKNLANLMVKRVIAGQMTLEGMQSYLLSQGFTLKEVGLYVDAANAALQDKTKQPSTAEIGEFLKKDILTYGEAVNAFRIDGWDDSWIGKLLTYYGGINVSITDATGAFAAITPTELFGAQTQAGKPAA